MSFGRWLDDAYASAASAATRLRTQPLTGEDVRAVVAARDQAYRQIVRLAGMIRGVDYVTDTRLSDGVRELQTADRKRSDLGLLAIGVRGAITRAAAAAAVTPRGQATVSLVAASANHLAMAGDLLATHVDSRPDLPGQRRRHGRTPAPAGAPIPQRQPTIEGAAITAGAERAQAVAELARITTALIRIDRAVLAAAPFPPLDSYLDTDVVQRLRAWCSDPYPEFLTQLTTAGEATLLRTLQPATDADRAAGPKPVTSLRDVLRTLTDVSHAIHRDPRIATIGLVGAVARVGFAATVWSSRLTGDADQPSTAVLTAAEQWKQLARALNDVRDIRDSVAPAYADETRSAAVWLRDQARQGIRGPAMATAGLVIETQQALARLCGQAAGALKTALGDRKLLTALPSFTHESRTIRAGVQVQELAWDIAVPADEQVWAVLDNLATLHQQKPTMHPAAVISSVTQASFAAAPTASPARQAAVPAPSRPQPPTTGRRW